jgi:hypothetical protein
MLNLPFDPGTPVFPGRPISPEGPCVKEIFYKKKFIIENILVSQVHQGHHHN